VRNIFHTTRIRARYCESDALGHINNVSYFIYFEQARVDFLLDNQICDLSNWPFVLASVHCDYKRQMYVNDTCVIKTYINDIGRSSFKLGHEIRDQQSNELLAQGDAVLVHFDFIKQKSSPIPNEMLRKMKEYIKIEA
jgi:acyl-CoA thioester hydrolase